METPVFKLEGIVKSKNEVSDFEGPLSLILLLLSKDRIEIRDISISLILEQYLEYLGVMSELDLDIAGEFVAMASHLAYIKTKMLLSDDEDISELEQLISSLEQLHRGDIYVQIREAAQILSDLYTHGAAMMVGPPEYLEQEDYTYVHHSDDLAAAVMSLISRENTVIGSLNPREAVYPRRIIFSIPEKISEVLEKLRSRGTIDASEIFYDCGSRAELVATLIAVLELCRVGTVLLTGNEATTITYAGAGRDSVVLEFADEEYD